MAVGTVTILMCTRNGAGHLRAQLESFQAQTHRDWALWVSDDGSDDGTWQMLESFRSENPDHEIRLLNGPRQGAARNFLSLLCQPDLSGRTVALSDQDDVWMPEKLARAVDALTAGADAYAAQCIVTDSTLSATGRINNTARDASFENALVQNVLHGATLVLGPAALGMVQRAGPDVGVPFHDWWLYQVLTGCGFRLTIDREPVLYYRQHDDNFLGANQVAGARRRRGALLRGGEYRKWIQANLGALDGIRDDLTEPARAAAKGAVAAQAFSGPRRMLAYRQLGLHRQTPVQTALLMTLTTLGYA